jgi:hypothetical protein
MPMAAITEKQKTVTISHISGVRNLLYSGMYWKKRWLKRNRFSPSEKSSVSRPEPRKTYLRVPGARIRPMTNIKNRMAPK